jgi:hypothetical protein
MERSVMDALNITHHGEMNASSSSMLADSFAVYLAFCVLGAAVIYLSLQNYRLHRSHYRSNQNNAAALLNPSSIAEEVILRLPELDHVYNLWSTWLVQELARLNEPMLQPNKSKAVGNSEANMSQNSRNKRRTSKKRH